MALSWPGSTSHQEAMLQETLSIRCDSEQRDVFKKEVLKYSWNAGSNFRFLVGCQGLRHVGGRKLSMHGCTIVESLDLKTSFRLISFGIGRAVDDGCRSIVAAEAQTVGNTTFLAAVLFKH